MNINDIEHAQIKQLAWKYRKANTDTDFYKDTIYGGFVLHETKEGSRFWLDVDKKKPVKITDQMRADHPEIFGEDQADFKEQVEK
jgi:hypothetical protein